MLTDAQATLITTSVRSGSETMISMSGTLDGAVGASAAATLLEQADVAVGDFHLDLSAVELVDGAEVVLVNLLLRRLAVRGHQLHLSKPATRSATAAIRPASRPTCQRQRCDRSPWRVGAKPGRSGREGGGDADRQAPKR